MDGRFVLRADNRVGFEIGVYDRSRELVIDPNITYSTYFGGSGNETYPSIAVNGDGFIYLAGSTTSTRPAGHIDGFSASVEPGCGGAEYFHPEAGSDGWNRRYSLPYLPWGQRNRQQRRVGCGYGRHRVRGGYYHLDRIFPRRRDPSRAARQPARARPAFQTRRVHVMCSSAR